MYDRCVYCKVEKDRNTRLVCWECYHRIRNYLQDNGLYRATDADLMRAGVLVL